MKLNPRISASFVLVLCCLILVFEWALRTRVGTVHPMALLIFSAGATLSFTGVVAPEITRLTSEGKLSPLAHKIGLVGFAIGGALIYWLR